MPIHFPLIAAQAVDTSAGTSTFHKMVQGVCGFIRPIVDKGNVVSLLLVMTVLVMAFLWYFNPRSEDIGGGWTRYFQASPSNIIRVAFVTALILNVFTFPSLVGLPGVCGN